MFGYIIIFSIMLLLQFYPVRDDRHYMWRTFFTFGILFLYGGLRSYCNDWDVYEDYYKQTMLYGALSAFDINDHMEKGWTLFNHLFSSFQYVVFAQTAIMCIAYGFISYKYIPARYSWIVILLLFLSGDKSVMIWSAMRNTIVIDMLLLCLPFMIKNNWKWLILAVPLAMQFHTSALVFFPFAAFIAYWGKNAKMNLKELLIWIVVLIILVVFPSDMLSRYLMSVMSVEDLYRYQTYLLNANRNTGVIITISSIFLSSGLLFYLFKYAKSKEEHIIVRLGLVFTYSYFLGALNIRVSQYFVFFFILSCVIVYQSNMTKLYKMAYLLFILLFFAYGLFVVELQNPYCSFTTFKSFI